VALIRIVFVMIAAERVTGAIRRLRNGAVHRSIVVALDGHSSAGKSTLAAVVANRIDAAVVHADDFYRDMLADERLQLTPPQGIDRYFDWERLRLEAVLPLARGNRARYRPFDWVTGHGLTTRVTVEPSEVVLLEGVYSARPELEDLLDLKILVEVADATREQRRQQRARTVSRDDPHGWDARWHAAERHYFGTIRPRETFDLIVDGDS
jgi:uridine kinase